MSDQPFYTPNHTPTPLRQPQPGVRMFAFRRGHDRFLCDLRDDGPHGVDARFLQNEDLLYTRHFATRALAVRWAEAERKAIEREALPPGTV